MNNPLICVIHDIQDWQCHKEPLELHHEAKGGTGGLSSRHIKEQLVTLNQPWLRQDPQQHHGFPAPLTQSHTAASLVATQLRLHPRHTSEFEPKLGNVGRKTKWRWLCGWFLRWSGRVFLIGFSGTVPHGLASEHPQHSPAWNCCYTASECNIIDHYSEAMWDCKISRWTG